MNNCWSQKSRLNRLTHSGRVDKNKHGTCNVNIIVFRREADSVFSYPVLLKSDKKNQDNAAKFIPNQIAKFGLVLSKNKNQPKIIT